MKQTTNLSCLVLFLTLISGTASYAQYESFIVKRTTFSSRITDEFSPAWYRDGLAFCSNQVVKSIIGYNENQKGLFNILYVKKTSSGWKQPGILAVELNTIYNDGPVSFNSSGNTAYFSRNNRVDNVFGNVNDTTNKLGIFTALLSGEKWTDIKPFPFSDPRFNYSTPALSPDETRIYFSSDKPGGYGGMDLYYSDFRDGNWKEPVNLGPQINTARSESFPFASPDGKLFFSSDGLPGFGGKDIYYSKQIEETWITPVHLDSAINSHADDFGLITDSTFKQGYFSSNRMNTDDIFSFTLFQPGFAHCDTIQENNHCYTFYDERQQLIDTVPAIYSWDFGDGKIRKGKEVQYCFPGAGDYTVRLTITDAIEGKVIAEGIEYKVNLSDADQALIHSDNIGLVNQPMPFHGITTSLTEFNPTAYYWDFGDGFRPGGLIENMTYGKTGEFTVRLGLWGQKDSLGNIPEKCYQKDIRIFRRFEELALTGMNEGPMQIRVFLMDDLPEIQKQKIKEIFIYAGDLDQGAGSPVIEKISSMLRDDPDISLETVTIPAESTQDGPLASEKLSQEFACHFRNQMLPRNSFHCTVGKLPAGTFKKSRNENKTGKMIVEFIFMKSINP